MGATEQILGQQDVISRLWGALERDALHHAYLFEGPPGLGKHTVAKLLAQAANCEADVPVADRPCGRCRSCVSIANGSHPDFITLAPAADRKTPVITVAQVRELVRGIHLSRFSARRRVIVVDPAEAMRTEAANALLKTLEEPPDETGFILVTSQASSLLPTINSRCQRVRFKPVGHVALTEWLRGRGLMDPETLASLSMGRPGAALQLADGGLEEHRARREALLRAISGDLAGIYDWSQRLAKLGGAPARAQARRVLDLLEDLLRDATLRAQDRGPLLNTDLPDVVSRWASALWPTGIVRCVDAVHDAREQLSRNVNTKTVLEALVTRVATELGAARRYSPAPSSDSP